MTGSQSAQLATQSVGEMTESLQCTLLNGEIFSKVGIVHELLTRYFQLMMSSLKGNNLIAI
jgi:hypothetical protein